MANFSADGVRVFVNNIVYDICPTEEDARRTAYMLNNCDHSNEEQIDVSLANGEISLYCDVCSAEASFQIPVNLEWSR